MVPYYPYRHRFPFRFLDDLDYLLPVHVQECRVVTVLVEDCRVSLEEEIDLPGPHLWIRDETEIFWNCERFLAAIPVVDCKEQKRREYDHDRPEKVENPPTIEGHDVIPGIRSPGLSGNIGNERGEPVQFLESVP